MALDHYFRIVYGYSDTGPITLSISVDSGSDDQLKDAANHLLESTLVTAWGMAPYIQTISEVGNTRDLVLGEET